MDLIKAIKEHNTLFDLYYLLVRKFAKIFLFRKNNGFFILDEDWDNLIILDACRYDIFRKLYLKRKIKGKLFKKISRGSHTIEYLLENFKNKKYDDIVYLTSTPYVNIYCKNNFHKIISVWKYGWDPQFLTVTPESMFDYAIEALIKYPNKRLIIHFMQPHFPYIGYSIKDLRRNIREEMKKKVKKNDGIYFLEKKFKKSLFSLYTRRIFALLTDEFQIKAYIKNLKLVLPVVEKLIEILPGKTAVSTDHGESFGEKMHNLFPIKFYGHDINIRIPSLVEIPWLLVKPEEKDVSFKKEFIKIAIEREKLRKIIKRINIGNF